MSLLEVLTALAIFIFSAYALTQMVENASTAATKARRLTKAQLLAETKMDEVISGAIPLNSTNGNIDEETAGWTYTVTVNPETWSAVQDASTGQTITGLNTVIVTVDFSMPGSDSIEYSISRLILDLTLRLPAQPSTSSTSTGMGVSP